MSRIKGAFAPELLLAQLLPQGTKCRFMSERDTTAFGRYVASIEDQDGRDVASVLVEAGHVTPLGRTAAAHATKTLNEMVLSWAPPQMAR